MRKVVRCVINTAVAAALFFFFMALTGAIITALLPKKTVVKSITEVKKTVAKSKKAGLIAIAVEEGIVVALPSAGAYLLFKRSVPRERASLYGVAVGISVWSLCHLLNMSVLPPLYVAGQTIACASGLAALPVMSKLKLRCTLLDLLSGHFIAHLLLNLPLLLS